MKVSCEIVKDILPLYHDDVCSKESRALIEEHIKECTKCREMLSALADDLTHPIDVNAIDDIGHIKAISTAWAKTKKWALLRGAAVALLICAILVGGYFVLTRPLIPTSPDSFWISEAAMLSDGRAVFDISDGTSTNSLFLRQDEDSGALYIIPRHPVISGGSWGYRTINAGEFAQSITFHLGFDVRNFVTFDPVAFTSLYIGSGRDSVLVWEAGMELPLASEQLEAMFMPDRGEFKEPLETIDILDGKTFLSLSDGQRILEVRAHELANYQLYTNSKQISISIPRGEFESTFRLYDTQNTSDFIMEMKLDQQKRSGTFTNLTSARNYYIISSGIDESAMITVTD